MKWNKNISWNRNLSWNKAAGLTGLFLCIIGGILFCTGKAAVGNNTPTKDINRMHSQDKDIISMKKTKISSYQNLQVNLKHLDLYILESDDNNYYMEYVLQKTKKKNPFCYQYQGNTLVLTEKDGRTASYYREVKIGIGASLLGMHHQKEYKNIILLYLPPKAKLEQCQIMLQKGDTEIQRLIAENLNCSLESGDFSADHLSADTGDIALHDGDLDCGITSFTNKIAMKSVDGDISVKLPPKQAHNISILGCTKEGDINAAKKYKGTCRRDEENDTYCYTANENHSLPSLSLYTEYGDIELD